MKVASCALFLIVALVQSSYQRSTPESDSYVAAVVEFSPIDPTSPGESPARINAAGYVSFIEKAAKQNADIVVFPEGGLLTLNLPPREQMDSWSTLIPAPSRNYNPCIHSTVNVSETLKMISCSARDNLIYVVINIPEKVICKNEACPGDGKLYHNTNVVFDRAGKIMARYRKSHFYREPQFNLTAVPEVVTFDTDFGVTFGTFICADILYKQPGMYLTRMLNITDIIFTTAWFTELPVWTPLQVQAGWAFSENVNLLVAGYNRPKFGNAGSGVYLGRRGVAKAVMPQTTTREIVVVEVPKKNSSLAAQRARPPYSYSEEEARPPVEEHHVHDELRRRRSLHVGTSQFHDELRKKRSDEFEERSKREDSKEEFHTYQYDISEYKSLAFNSSVTHELCDGDFCCNFNVELSNVDPRSNYRLVVYDGVITFEEPYVSGIRNCLVVLCENDTISSCGYLDESETRFDTITINATYPNYEDVLVFSSSVGANLFPLANWTYEERYENKKVHITASLGTPSKNVVTCGLVARDFSRDGLAEKDGWKNGTQWATLTALAIVSLFLIFLYRKGWRKPWHRDGQIPIEGGPYQHLHAR